MIPIPPAKPAVRADFSVRAALAFFTACFLLLGAPDAAAERYVTSVEARKLLFPDATHFADHVVRFTAEEKKSIESASHVKVLSRGNRVSIASRDTNVLGVIVVDHVLGKHEIIDYAIAIAPDGSVVGIEILEYRESHGWEIRGDKWRDQFKGKSSGSKLKLNDDIYNISGATISCRHVTEGVKRVLATFDLVLRPRLLDGRMQNTAAVNR